MNLLGWFHTLCALVALASGAVVLLRAKGTRRHRQMGWIYVGSMLAVNVTALMIYRLFGGFGPFHVAALFSLATVIAGIIPAVRRRPHDRWLERHYFFMAYSYVGLLAATAAEIGTRLPGARGAFWLAVILASIGVFVIGGAMIRRQVGATLAPFRTTPAGDAAD